MMSNYLSAIFVLAAWLICSHGMADDELSKAIMAGDADAVLQLVAKDPKALERDVCPYGIKPLQLSALLEERKVAEAILKHGQKLDAFTAYHLGMNEECIRLLKADPKAIAKRIGESGQYGGPIYWTIMKNDVQMAKRFVNLGAKVDTEGESGSVLRYAVAVDRVEIAKLLLEHGADIKSAIDPSVGSLLHEARSAAMVDLLLKHGVKIESRNESDETPLYVAVECGALSAVKRLLERGASMVAPCHNNYICSTPLELALAEQYGGWRGLIQVPQAQRKEIAKLMLARKPRLDFRLACMANDLKVVRDCVNKDPKILTTPIPYLHFALDWAVLHDNMEMFNFFVERYETKVLNGGSIRDEAKKDFGPILLTAVKCDHAKMVQRLLDLGAVVGDPSVSNPLFVAIESNAQLGIIKALLRQSDKAKLSAKEAELRSIALTKSIYFRRFDALKLILKECSDPDAVTFMSQRPLIEAITRRDEAALALLLKYKVDLSAPPHTSFTPLHTAARMGTAKIVEMLLKHGASVNAVGGWMQTPLHRAAEADWAVPMLKVLLAAGAKHNVKDKSGNTPLHLAAFNFNAEGVKLLLEAGANPRVKNREGRTPIEMIEFRRAIRYPTDSLDWNKFWAAIRCQTCLDSAAK